MTVTNQANPEKEEGHRQLIEAIIAYVTFCGLGFLSRFAPPIFLLFLVFGIAFPLIWAKLTHDWASIGFTRRKLGEALLWGLGAGLAWGFYTYAVFREEQPLPPLFALQVIIAFPIWLLVMSPFQEFFFRGWLQPRLQAVTGEKVGLVITSLAFTLWHFFPQFEGTMTATLPLSSFMGILSIFAAGLLFGYIYQHTESIVAPWLAHAVGGIALVLIGGMSFIQYTP